MRPAACMAGLCLLLGLVSASRAQEPTGPLEAPPAPTLTRAPTVVRESVPDYPLDARGSGRRVEVTLTLTLSSLGEVDEVSVASPPQPPFDESAVEAAHRLLFTPAEVDGAPAAVRITYRYLFVDPGPTSRAPDAGEGRGSIDTALSPAPETNPDAAEKGHPRSGTEPADSALPAGRGEPPSPSAEGLLPVQETVVRARRRAPPGSSTLTLEEARRIPGTAGDGMLAVQTLPGVARPPAGSGALALWGATPEESRIFVDDVPLPYLFHRGGYRSVLSDAWVAELQLQPAAFSVAHGRAVGGVLHIETQSPTRVGLHGSAQVDLLSAGTALEWKSEHSGHSLQVAAGTSTLDRWGRTLVESLAPTVALPRAWHYAARGASESPGMRTTVFALGARDDVSRTLESTRGAPLFAERSESQFHLAALTHQRSLPGGVRLLFTTYASHERSALASGKEELRTTSQSARTNRAGVRASRRQPLSARVTMNAGLDVELSRSAQERTGTLGLPAREGDVVAFGQVPGDRVSADAWTVGQAGLGVWGLLDWRPFGEAFRLEPSLRLEPTFVEGDRVLPPTQGGVDVGFSGLEVGAEPRLSSSLRLGESWTVEAAVSHHRQPPSPADLSSVFGNPSLPSSRAEHALAGLTFAPPGAGVGKRLELVVFGRRLHRLAVRSTLAQPALATSLEPTGEGRVAGAQLVARLGGRWLSGWLSYALSRAERRAAPGAPWRRFDFDQPHAVTAVVGVMPRPRLQLGARLRVASGFPRTPVEGAVYESVSDRYQPRFGEHNTSRLPPFFQLDLHAEQTFTRGDLRLTPFVELINVTHRQNAEERAYSEDYSRSVLLTGYPFLAVLGVRVEL